MDHRDLFEAEFADHGRTWEDTRRECAAAFGELASTCVEALRNGGKLLLFGNGGSAADAQHIATELTVRYKKDRRALPAIALTTDSSALTAIGNDFGFDFLFSRQIEALGKPGDVAVGFSTSGNSENVLRGLAAARQGGLTAAGLTGGDGGRLASMADPLLIVPAKATARIQEMHILVGHVLCDVIERDLGLA